MVNGLSCSNRKVPERYAHLVIELVIEKEGLVNSFNYGSPLNSLSA